MVTTQSPGVFNRILFRSGIGYMNIFAVNDSLWLFTTQETCTTPAKTFKTKSKVRLFELPFLLR